MLNYVGELLALTGPSIKEFWPTSYYTAVSLLNECGKPVETKICFNCQHPLHWYALSKTENCPSCETDPQLMRYYLPLKTKLKLWFSSPEMCFDMLAHWRSKDVWFNSDGPTFPLKELWDGSRFKQLKWFWDPNCSWPLPHKCKECKQFINLLETNVVIGMPFDLTCADCGTQDQIIASFVKGDPRNIGLIGHFDGWQPGFGKVANHSSGVSLTTYNVVFLLVKVTVFGLTFARLGFKKLANFFGQTNGRFEHFLRILIFAFSFAFFFFRL